MIKVREVEDKDIISLADFLPAGIPNTTQEFWLHRFELWWTSNPAYTPQIPRGWVLENDTAIVGFIGNIPVKFLVRGEVKIAAASSSWYVDPSVRGIFSLRLFNEFLKQKNVSLYLFKAEDEPLREILHKYKFEEHILPPFQKEYVYIIDKKKVDFILLKFLFGGTIPKLSELPELYKRIGLVFFGYIYQKPVITRGVLPGEAYTSSLCTSCDDTFIRIWEPYLDPCDVTLSHDIETLNWLYFPPARFLKRVVIQCHRSRDKTLAGYMVFDIARKKQSDPGSMLLMEMCIEDNDPQVLASLLSCALETGKQNNAALLVVWANSQETDAFFRSTFTLRSADKQYRYIKFSDAPEMSSGKNNHGNVCMSLIYPPE
jgi:hypothetical protein